ncbi:30S ribosomal protein S7, partial [Halorubrum sp. E3]
LLFIPDGVANATYKSTTAAAEALANELITAADYDPERSYSISQKEERERVAAAAR